MADIFISYSQDDRSWVGLLAIELESEGWSVWWDRELIAGDSVDQLIESEVNKASCVIVVWSQSSIVSDWVRDEAEIGRDREVLLPILIDDIKPRMGFRGIQAQNFIDWQGNHQAEAYISLSKSISRHAQKSNDLKPTPEQFSRANQIIDGGKVNINYGSEIGGQVFEKELPLVVGVLGHFSGTSEFRASELMDRSFIPVSLTNRDQVLSSMEPSINFRVPNRLAGQQDFSELDIVLTFQQFSDFDPASIQANLEILNWVTDFYQLLSQLVPKFSSEELDPIERLFELPFSPKNWLDRLADLVQDCGCETKPSSLHQNPAPGSQWHQARFDSPEVSGVLHCLIDELRALGPFSYSTLDELSKRLSEQLNEILHANKFQQLEASWRGLSLLLTQNIHQSDVIIKLFDVSKTEILIDLQAGSFDRTAIYRKLYEEQYGVANAAPFGLLLGDWTIGTGESDLELVEVLARIASESHLPMVMSANQELMDVRNQGMGQNTNSVRWSQFRKSDQSRYITLTAPKVLLRSPYEDPRLKTGYSHNDDLIPFIETITSQNHYLWGNAVYALASSVTQTFNRFGWYATLSHPMYGGNISQLPTYNSADERVGPTSILISQGLEEKLSEYGLMPLVQNSLTSSANFNTENTLHLPDESDDEQFNLDEQTNAKLSSLLTLTRILQYLVMIARDGIGSFMESEDLQLSLNDWLATYVCEEKQINKASAKQPLLDANVTVTPVKGIDHLYNMELSLVAGYQFNHPANMKFKTRLPG